MVAATGATGLTDKNKLIDASRGLANSVAFLTAKQAAAGVHISIISAMELVSGSSNATELAQEPRFLQRVTMLPVSPTA